MAQDKPGEHEEDAMLGAVLIRLEALIRSRQGGDPGQSYTAGLLADPPRAAKKMGEEAVEAVVAALSGDATALAAESADLLYHLCVLLVARGVPLSEVALTLRAREGRSGLEEKASRKV